MSDLSCDKQDVLSACLSQGFFFILNETTVPQTPYKNLAILMLGGGALLMLMGVCAVVGFLVAPFTDVQNPLGTNTTVFSFGAVALVYGSILAWLGLGFRRGHSGGWFALPSPLILLALFVVVLVIGQGVLSLNIATSYLFPLWHVLGSLLVPLAILSFAGRRLPPVSMRTMLAQFTWGGLVTIALALVFELVIAGFLLVLGTLGVTALLGLERAMELATALQAASQDPERVMELLRGEPIVLVVVVVLAVALFVILVPLLEELLKATGPAILILRRMRADAAPLPGPVVMWGLVSGAGYAFTETMFNAQTAVPDGAGGAPFWVTAMILRAGTSLMHMIATGTVAVAWYELFVGKRRSRFFVLLGAAVAIHAVWNSGAVLLGGVGVLNTTSRALGSIVGICALMFLVFLFFGCLIWLTRLIRWAQPLPIEIITSSGTLLEIKG